MFFFQSSSQEIADKNKKRGDLLTSLANSVVMGDFEANKGKRVYSKTEHGQADIQKGRQGQDLHNLFNLGQSDSKKIKEMGTDNLVRTVKIPDFQESKGQILPEVKMQPAGRGFESTKADADKSNLVGKRKKSQQ